MLWAGPGHFPQRGAPRSDRGLPRASCCSLTAKARDGLTPRSARTLCQGGRRAQGCCSCTSARGRVTSSKGSAALSIIKSNFPGQSREITQAFALLICC